MRMIIAVLGVLLTFGAAEVSAAPFSVTLATDGIPSDFAVTSDGTRVVVGGSSLDNPTPRIWVYSPSGELEVIDVAMPANVSAAGATSISPNGRYVAINALEAGQFKAFVYDRQNGTLDRRGPSASGPTSDSYSGYAINDSGDIYGSSAIRPFTISASNESKELQSPTGAGIVWGVSESPSGIAVGFVSNVFGGDVGALWDSLGDYHDLSFGAGSSMARGISPDGNLVVGHRDDQLTYWLGGSYTTLDFYGELMGATSSGFMWGYQWQGEEEIPIVYALGWSEPVEFNQWLSDLGITTGTTALKIAGCLDRGPTVDCAYEGSVGFALDLPNPTFSGETPVPEPATMTLLGLGLLGVATRLRRRPH